MPISPLSIWSQGCAAALPYWRLADALLASGQCEHVLSICVDVSSAAMYLDNDPGVLISACLFGDGAGDGSMMLRLAQRRAARWPGVKVTLLDRLELVEPPRRRLTMAISAFMAITLLGSNPTAC